MSLLGNFTQADDVYGYVDISCDKLIIPKGKVLVLAHLSLAAGRSEVSPSAEIFQSTHGVISGQRINKWTKTFSEVYAFRFVMS